MSEGQDRLKAAARIVVKVGSSTVVDGDGRVRGDRLASLCADLDAWMARGVRVIVVSSGAVALGRTALGGPKRLGMVRKQAAAAVGQVLLMQAWRDALAAFGRTAAQVLLTLDDSEDRRRWLNASATFGALGEAGIVAVVNENDTVATAEIRVGDNDRLAARTAQMAGADVLILLSDVDGLHSADPRLDPKAPLISEIRGVTPEIEAMAGGAGTSLGTGGMATKLAAARICLSSGCAMAVASGAGERPLAELEAGGAATWFLPGRGIGARKGWLLGRLESHGTVWIDRGAVAALRRGGSLLLVGAVRIDGDFHEGERVRVAGEDSTELGWGLAGMGAAEARARIGERAAPPLVHRDDLVLHS